MNLIREKVGAQMSGFELARLKVNELHSEYQENVTLPIDQILNLEQRLVMLSDESFGRSLYSFSEPLGWKAYLYQNEVGVVTHLIWEKI